MRERGGVLRVRPLERDHGSITRRERRRGVPLTLARAEAALDDAARRLGDALAVDGPALLRERSEILGIAPRGTTSAGGTCRLLQARDGRWLAMNLARRSDVELLAAWMQCDWEGPPWDAVARALEGMTAEDAVERAQLLGIPAAVAVSPAPYPRAVTVTEGTKTRGARLVVDLSALWAGPLCTRLLGTRGIPVVKVEHVGRPDGARAGPPEFWDRLNGQKHEVTLDFSRGSGRAALDAVLDDAAIVVTSARPRAIDQLGLGLRERVERAGLVWVSITGYGLEAEWHDRVAFGDDAAVAGGLAVAAGGEDAPVFVGDAPADPLAGLTGAVAAASALEERRGALIDVSMRDVVAMELAAERYPAGMRQEVA